MPELLEAIEHFLRSAHVEEDDTLGLCRFTVDSSELAVLHDAIRKAKHV